MTRRPKGYTLLEALLLVTVLGITGAAAGKALTAMTHSPEQNNNDLATETALLDKMEYVRAQPFSTIAAEAGKSQAVFSDTVTVGSPAASVSRLVTVNYVVPSTGALAGAATQMVQVKVTVGGKSATTLVTQP